MKTPIKSPISTRLTGSLSKLSQAASAKKDSISGTVVFLHPDECIEVKNPRTVFDPVLVESIAEDFTNPDVGQQEPIVVYEANEAGKYAVQYGATRLRAAKIAIKVKPDFRLKAIIDANLHKKPESAQYLERGKNNIKRDNMSVRDRAEFIGDYMEMAKAEGENITQADVAKQLGFKNTSVVSRLLKLRGMSPEIESLCQSGKTEDIETLATLVDIQKDTPELFQELLALPEIDRGTVRRAKKEGRLQPVESGVPSALPVGKAEESDAQSERDTNFAHAQNGTGDTDSDNDVVVIPYMEYPFKTGRINILIKKSDSGFLSALETAFEHGINEKGEFGAQAFATESEAVENAKGKIPAWAEMIVSDKTAVTVEEYQDVAGFLAWLKDSGKTVVTDTSPKEKAPVKKTGKPAQKTAVIFGEVRGEECVLLLKVPEGAVDEAQDKEDSKGHIWVQIGDKILKEKEADFKMTSISYRE